MVYTGAGYWHMCSNAGIAADSVHMISVRRGIPFPPFIRSEISSENLAAMIDCFGITRDLHIFCIRTVESIVFGVYNCGFDPPGHL